MLHAAWTGNVRGLTRLLRNNANIEERAQSGESPLQYAARYGHEGAVRLLLGKNANIAASDNTRRTSLHWAAFNGHEGVVRLLLEKNADIAARDNIGRSPLHWAARSGHVGVVRLLLENNADIAATDGKDHTALESTRNGEVAALLGHPAATASQPQQAPVEQGGTYQAETRRDGSPAESPAPQPPAPAQQAVEEEARPMGEQLTREREGREAAEAQHVLEDVLQEACRLDAELARTKQQLERTEQQLERTKQQLDAVLQAQQRGIAAFSIAVLQGATGNFSDANKIGRGGFGTVFRTDQPLPSLPHIGRCAVKRLDPNSMQGHHEVRSEIRVLSVCWHEHLLPLVGFCLDEDAPCLVYPLMAGNLESRVVNPPQGQQLFSWQERVRAIRDATRALVYLHMPLETRSPVLHRDVKPSNILLDAHGNAKLADVGLAREVPELQGGPTHAPTQTNIGTPGFVDPLYKQSRQFGKLNDGYAMGVSLLMCLGGQSACDVVNRFGGALEDEEQRRAPASNFTDPTAEWPPDVAKQALKVVRGLMWSRTASRRMVLSQALTILEDIANERGLRPGIADVEDEGRSCVICMSAPRSVRFNCGHALCCTVNGCAVAIQRRGVCPNCRAPISSIADQGDHIALQRTFVAVNPIMTQGNQQLAIDI